MKTLLIFFLMLTIVGITGCQSQVISPAPEIPCSIEITNPKDNEHLNGNKTYEIKWKWTGSNEQIDLMLVGYDIEGKELGMMPIDHAIQASNESYLWGPNFGASIFENFGLGENWPWWFKIKADVPNTDIWDTSEFFSVQWDYNL
jgi:hypothetical protein